MKKPVKAGATVRLEAAKARKAARLAKARQAGRSAMASRTAQSTLAAAIGAGILLQGGPASPPSVEMVVRTVAIAGPADVVDEPESSADESASGEAGDTGTGDTDSEATSGETVSDDSGESDTGAGGTGSDASGSDDDQAAPDGSDETTTPSAEPEPTTEPASQPEPEVVPDPDPEPSPQPATPATTAGPTAATPPSGAPTTSATPTSTAVAASGAAARPAGDRTAATPTARATHSATQNLFTRIALALAGLAPHDAHVPGGPATPTSALLIAQWAFFRRGENPLFNQSPVASPTQSAQTTTGEITGDLNASDPDRDRLTYEVTRQPGNGQVVLGDDGTYTYIPNAATAQTGGTDTFTITVRDNNPAAPGLGGFTALARHVLARSHPALAERLFGAHTVAVTVDVMVTGTTAPPIPADVTVGTPDQATGVVRGTLPATDASGAPLTYTVTTPPAYGRVTVRPDGSYVYVPSAAGQAYARAHPGAFDTFTVRASSGATARFAARVAPGDELTVPVPLAQSAPSVPPTATTSTGVGTYPGSALVGPGGRYVAVPSYQDRTVTIVDTTNGTRSVVALDADLSEVVFSPDGGRAYVLDQGGLITVADTVTGAVVGSVDLGNSGQALRVAPDGRHLYVTGRSGEVGQPETLTLTAIDTTDYSPHPLAVGGFFNGVEFTPDGRRGYATDFENGAVLIIDAANGTVIDTVSAGYGVARVIFNPAGTRAYVPNENVGTITVIHTDDDTVGPVLDVGAAAFSLYSAPLFSPDGRQLYLLDYGGTVRILDTATDTLGDPIPVDAPNGVVFSPDGSRAYVVSGNDQLETLTVIRTADQSVVRLATGPVDREVVFSPDGSRAYLVSYAGRVTAIDVANDAVSATYDVAPQAFDLVLTPDGTRAYVVHVNDEYGTAGIVTALDTATGATTTIAVGDRPDTPIVSPDGRRVYVTNYFSGTVSVIDTADDTVVATVRGYAEARLTPDGRFVYARSTVGERAGITFISTTDDLVTFIPVSAAEEGLADAQLSPDGQSFYVISNEDDSVLIVVSLDGDQPALGDGARTV